MPAESASDEIARLMAEGLEHYGQDRVEQAVACWRAVLRLEPDHGEACDYLRSAGYEPAAQPKQATSQGLLLEAVELCRQGQAEQALELLESLPPVHARDLHVQGYVELIRSHLYDQILEHLDDGKRVPVMKLGPGELMRFNLPANAGFVLSMVDGMTSVNDLVALSGMDPFEVVHTLHRLLEAGIVGEGA